jgi:uncharacterized damage-inducible protein DinB
MSDPVTCAQLLTDGFDRIRQEVEEVLDGLSAEQLAYSPAPGANSIGWLVWHLTRVQDDHVAGVAGAEQVWTAEGYYDRFELPFDRAETGYGQRPEQAAAVRVPSARLLADYHRAVSDRSTRYLAGLTERDLAAVVDEAWDPPVTLAVRLVSVLSDDLQHVGQAAYLRGLSNPAA